MKLFRCTCPDRPLLYFENTVCGHCGRLTGFVDDAYTLRAFVPGDSTADMPDWVDDDGRRYRQCANWRDYEACNWMTPAEDDRPYCRACELNDIVPDLGVTANLPPWRALEAAKRRCLYTLQQLGLPFGNAVVERFRDAGLSTDDLPILSFRFLADADASTHFDTPLDDEKPVMTGHADGVITINLAEGDPVARSRAQASMNESYRTQLGHFRHECGHYYWDLFRLVDAGFLDGFRATFGDDRDDYADALRRHYARPADDTSWQTHHVSSYASAHPWEDWAETFAHYLHMVDTLETQQAFAEVSRVVPDALGDVALPASDEAERLPALQAFDEMMRLWVDVSIVLNSLNRSMGLPDPYPFVLSETIREKLRHVHGAVQASRDALAGR